MLPRLSLFHIRKINADFYASRSLSSRMTRKTILSQPVFILTDFIPQVFF